MDYMSLFFLLGNVLGFVLKKAAWYPTKFVPGAIFVSMALGRLLLGLGIEPQAAAPELNAVHYAGIGFWVLLQTALVDTLKAVAFHSITKNSIQGMRKEA